MCEMLIQRTLSYGDRVAVARAVSRSVTQFDTGGRPKALGRSWGRIVRTSAFAVAVCQVFLQRALSYGDRVGVVWVVRRGVTHFDTGGRPKAVGRSWRAILLTGAYDVAMREMLVHRALSYGDGVGVA